MKVPSWMLDRKDFWRLVERKRDDGWGRPVHEVVQDLERERNEEVRRRVDSIGVPMGRLRPISRPPAQAPRPTPKSEDEPFNRTPTWFEPAFFVQQTACSLNAGVSDRLSEKRAPFESGGGEYGGGRATAGFESPAMNRSQVETVQVVACTPAPTPETSRYESSSPPPEPSPSPAPTPEPPPPPSSCE